MNEFITRCSLLVSPHFTPKPTVPQVLPLVREFLAMPGNGIGGQLHIVLDEGNVNDEHVDMCIAQARDTSDHCAQALGWVLRRMSKTQRRKLSALVVAGYN